MANQLPGDFSLKEVSLYSVYNNQKLDIKNLVLEINLYESIFFVYPTGGNSVTGYWTKLNQ